MNTAQYAVQQLNDSSLWNNIHPDLCECRGGGWVSSAYDTWHRCSIHAGSGHPEDSEDYGNEGPWQPFCEPEYNAEILADFPPEELASYHAGQARYKREMAEYEVELAAWEEGAAEREIELEARREEEAREYREHRDGLYRNATAYYRAFCIEHGMTAEAFDAEMASEDSEAADGTVRAFANAALAIFHPVMQEAQEADARSRGYRSYSESLYADAYAAEQWERETGCW